MTPPDGFTFNVTEKCSKCSHVLMFGTIPRGPNVALLPDTPASCISGCCFAPVTFIMTPGATEVLDLLPPEVRHG